MRWFCTLLLLFMAGPKAAFSGDLFNNNQDGGKLFPLEIHSETTLAGVNPEVSKIQEVIRKLGKPDRTTIHYTDGKHSMPLGGTYEWQTVGWRLRIETMNSGGSGTITQVDVWGIHPEGEIGTTGQGLRLGDAIADVMRVYRLPPYFDTSAQKAEKQYPRVPVLSNLTLQVQYDIRGRVDHLTLRAAPVY